MSKDLLVGRIESNGMQIDIIWIIIWKISIWK